MSSASCSYFLLLPLYSLTVIIANYTEYTFNRSSSTVLTRALEDRIAAFDNTCLRRILRIPYTAHTTTAEVRLRAGSPPQLLPLIETRRLRFFGHVARMGDSQDTSRALYTSIRWLPKHWSRRPGRPRRTWLRTLEADLQPLNHGLNSGPRTMEATCGNGYAPVRGMPAVMMMNHCL